jgi:hypothetical protein
MIKGADLREMQTNGRGENQSIRIIALVCGERDKTTAFAN